MVSSPDTKPGQPDALLAWMDALADPTRLRLLRLLEHHELGVADLCGILQMPQSTVSRHLKTLSDNGWTSSQRQGTANLYRMILNELNPVARQLWLLAREQTQDWAAFPQDDLRLGNRIQQKQQDAQAFFAGAAAQWDKLRRELYGQSFNQAALLSLLPADWMVADLGCGTGTVTVELAHYVKQVIGVDNSHAMLKAAQSRTTDLTNVEIRRGDLEAIPIDDEQCDAAVLLLALTYVKNPAVVLREASRIIKIGGRVVVVDLMLHDREDFRRQMGQQSLGFEPDELCQLIRESGMSQVKGNPLSPDEGTKGPALVLATASRAKNSL